MDFIYRYIMKALQPLRVLRNRWFGLFAIKTKPSNGPATPPETRSLTTSSESWCKTCYNLSEAIAIEHGEIIDPLYWRDPPCLYPMHGGGVYIFLNIQKLRESASTGMGCIICKFLERTFDTFIPDRDGDFLRVELKKSGLRYVLWRSRYFEIGVDLYRLPGEPGSRYEHIPARSHIELPNSESSMNYLKRCLKTCAEEHDFCRQDPLAPRPKRLLDVGSAEDDLVKLYETSGDFRQPYVALSYCWGKTEFLKAKRENLESLKRGFGLMELPESVRDAIHIVREVGLRYLWVDSLCIIQPDGTKEGMADWEEQSAKMCSVYEQAYLTIAASSANSADESFLRHSSRPRYFEYDITSVPGLTMVARMQCVTGHHHRRWDENPMPDDPLDKRGWVLQESLLSNRMISYSTDELQWRCKTTTTCECQEFINFIRPPVVTAGQTEREILDRWNDIVKGYSKRRFTNPNDKFPALSGVCELIQRQTGWQYVAGMWKEHLFRHLLWHAHEGTSEPLPPVAVAPSFSWASVDGTIVPLVAHRHRKQVSLGDIKDDYDEHVRLINLTVLPLDDNPFGRIKPGSSLTLEGKMMRNVWVTDRINTWPYRYLLGFSEGEGFFKLVEDVQLETFHFVDSNGLPQRSVKRSTSRADQTIVQLERGSTVSLLPLLSNWIPPSKEEQVTTYHMLVLGVSPINHDAFERLGTCALRNSRLDGSNFFDDIETEKFLIL
ncbi:HET-domain-containing protein [Hypomontagnella monticulosa]|nr:HET-domain-containing protein [Hypomontagnella monticulosa]